MLERRDFLKYFGVGASVVPVVGGILRPDAEAKLITAPKVELATAIPSPVPPDFSGGGKYKMCVLFTDKDEKRYVFECDTFVIDWRRELMDVTSYRDGSRQYLPALSTPKWTISGVPVSERYDMRAL